MLSQCSPDCDCRTRFGLGHCRSHRHVARAAPYLLVDKVRVRVDIRIDADINHNDFSSGAARKNVDGCPIRKKVSDHLLGHGLGIGAYALLGDAVIRGKDIDRLVRAAWRFLFPNRDNPSRDFLESAETAWRFGQTIQLRFREGLPIARGMDSRLFRKGRLR